MKKLIIANWKMNPTSVKESQKILGGVLAKTKNIKRTGTVFCPPFIFLENAALSIKRSRKRNIFLGAQNVFWKEKGAYTGAVSSQMLKSIDCRFCIVGHSERRKYFNETDEMINFKIKSLLKAGIKIVLCVGEKEREGVFDLEANIVGSQLVQALSKVSKKQAENLVIAYEPVWAIGSGHSDTPDQAFQAVLFIRKIFTSLYGRKIAETIPVLYGGSVNSKNAEGFLKEGGVDGFLVGGASLHPDEFVKIIKLAENIRE